MKTTLECLACFVKQAVRAAKLSTDDPALQRRAVNEVLSRVRDLELDASPAKLSAVVYAAVRETTGAADPYAAVKRETNRRALQLLPDLRRRAESSADPLHAAVKLALAGNVIDFGIDRPFDLEHETESILASDLTRDDYPVFKELLADCRNLLYVCDNSGEIAFDAFLVEKLVEHTEVIASVKSGPVINDATRADAEEVGLTKLCPVIETGADAVGVDWTAASEEFKDVFRAADIVVAKGQGNYETRDENPEEIFFILKVKCPVIADALRLPEGSNVFLRNRAR